MKTIIFFW